MDESLSHAERLVEMLRETGGCLVAFSGGVDSSVLAKGAQLALGDRAVAVTAVGPAAAEGELDDARNVARLIGIRHEICLTDAFTRPEVLRNDADRCYHCKIRLYRMLRDEWLPRLGLETIVCGCTLDDLGDYRPGNRASPEFGVLSPLADCGMSKQDVRRLAVRWELPVHDKPARPCLATRIVYGEPITDEKMRMIDRAEQFLRREAGLKDCRVRFHPGAVARIEVAADQIEPLCRSPFRERLADYFRKLGFQFVSIDLEGFQSGSLNRLLKKEEE